MSSVINDLEHLTGLTLFPRVSKTSETNLGYGLAILREHFFKHRFFEHDELVILTLMKGDEVVKTGEEGADDLLLLKRNWYTHRIKRPYYGRMRFNRVVKFNSRMRKRHRVGKELAVYLLWINCDIA